MNPLILVRHAIRAMIRIPQLLFMFMWNLLHGHEDAVEILQNQLPRQIFLLSPVAYVTLMIIALVTLMSSDGLQSVIVQIAISIACSLWMFVTVSLGLQTHDTRLIQAQSIQYYLLFVGFIQTVAWVVHPDNPKNEPSSVLILFMATTVAFLNEKVIKPNIERVEFVPANEINQPTANEI